MAFSSNPALGLYIHLPWCEKKCPYCDFNSHETDVIPETDYVDALLNDLAQDLPLIWGRRVETVFIGGGTPSLFSGAAIERLFSGLRALLHLSPGIEITLESNPGSADIEHFRAYRQSGVNRLSIGVQSFNDTHLCGLGRVHDSSLALQAVDSAREAGFDNINIDLIYGLPGQTLKQALADIQQAIALKVEHISHYQLSIEPNTLFHSQPPAQMPDDQLSWDQQCHCQALLADAGYLHYEISAYGQPEHLCQHNLNYWNFGDYLGIGAGAHGKITLAGKNQVLRRIRQRQPQAYLKQAGHQTVIEETQLEKADLIFEFMLNSLRLTQGFATTLFTENTGLSLNEIMPSVRLAEQKGLILLEPMRIRPSARGLQYLNDLQALFLEQHRRQNRIFPQMEVALTHHFESSRD